jgi:hypothetical protein
VAKRLRCFNELVLVVAEQANAGLAGNKAYPAGAFYDVLKEKADMNSCGGELRAALAHALSKSNFVSNAQQA